ncbi:MAG: YncE family protein [Parachlamydiales bacterium]|nr:YncE family protein [Parachlamydiales bacterium]
MKRVVFVAVLAFVQIAYSVDPTAFVVNIAGSDLTPIDIATDAPLPSVSTGSGPRQFAVSLDKTKLYVPNQNADSVSIIDLVTNMTLTVPLAGGDSPTSAVITPDGARVYIPCLFGNAVKYIDTSDNSLHTVSVPPMTFNNPTNLVVTPNSQEVYVTNQGASNVFVINNGAVPSLGPIITNVNMDHPIQIAASPDGTKVFVANGTSGMGNSYVFSINTTTHTPTVTNFMVNSAALSIAVTNDSARAYFAMTDVDQVKVLDTSNNTFTTVSTGMATQPVHCAVSTNNSKVFVALQMSNQVGVIDNSGPSPTMMSSTFSSSGMQPEFIGISPDGVKAYVSNTGSGTVTSFNQSTNAVITTGIMAPSPVYIGFAGSSPSVNPTSSVTGAQKSNRFFSQSELINVITWTLPSPGGPFVNYKIFRNAELTDLAGQVSGDSALIFKDQNRAPNQLYSYYIVAVDALGAESMVGSVTVAPL